MATLDNLRESVDRFVDDYCSDVGDDSTTTKGQAFATWCLTTIFSLSAEQAVEAIQVGGKGDNSLDAFFESDAGLTVLQCKFGSHDWSEITKTFQDVGRLLTVHPTGGGQFVLQVGAKLRTAYQRGDQIQCYYITSENFSGADLNKIHQLNDSRFEFTAWELSNVDYYVHEQEELVPSAAKGQYLLLKPSSAPLQFNDSLLMPVSLVDLARFMESGKDYLFASNVRSYLSRSKINSGIKDTINKDPQQFWRYNNGITIVCDEWTAEDSQIKIVAPQVVNGCQTALTVQKELATKDAAEKNNILGHVLVRVIKEIDSQERINITRYTNKQNAVKAKDFYALEEFHKALARKFQQLGYYYEIQNGSWDQLDTGNQKRFRGDSRFSHMKWNRRDYRIQAIESSKCYAAAYLGKIAVCYSDPGKLAPGGNEYDNLFTDELPIDAEPYLVPFLVLKHSEAAFGYGRRSKDFRSRSRYFFVATTFKVLTQVLKEAGLVDEGRDNLDPEDIQLVREVFSNESLASQVLQLADETLDNFFGDYLVKRQVGQDIFQFLKGPVEKGEPRLILVDKIHDLLKKSLNTELIAAVKLALPSR